MLCPRCNYTKIGDPVLHIDLAKRNQLLLFAPLDANTLHKVISGASSNLVSCLARAWYWHMETGVLQWSFLSSRNFAISLLQFSDSPVLCNSSRSCCSVYVSILLL